MSDGKLAQINGWRVVPPTNKTYEYRPTGFSVGNKSEAIVYVNGKRTDKIMLPKTCFLKNY